jgi:hypothetical protein
MKLKSFMWRKKDPKMSKKTELADRIKRRLGYPMIKVELHDDQITDSINFARNKFIKFAAGQATQEVFFTMMLSAGQYLYDMPDGTVEVISYDSSASSMGGINTLFTLGNFLYSQGMFGLLNPGNSESGYSLIGYHIAIDFLETLHRYTPDSYRAKYHKAANILEIQPPPASGNYLTFTDDEGNDTTYDSPGFVLVRAMMIDGSTLPDWQGVDSLDSGVFESQWVEDYATARAKMVLGMIRRKFASFSALGNQGATLDGSDLVSEAKEEMAALEDKLRLEETYIGWPIIVGSVLLCLFSCLGYLTPFLC